MLCRWSFSRSSFSTGFSGNHNSIYSVIHPTLTLTFKSISGQHLKACAVLGWERERERERESEREQQRKRECVLDTRKHIDVILFYRNMRPFGLKPFCSLAPAVFKQSRQFQTIFIRVAPIWRCHRQEPSFCWLLICFEWMATVAVAAVTSPKNSPKNNPKNSPKKQPKSQWKCWTNCRRKYRRKWTDIVTSYFGQRNWRELMNWTSMTDTP